MRKLFTTIILAIIVVSVYGQISNTKVVRVANASTVFSEPLSEGNILIDLNADKTYLILKAIEGSNSISALTAGVDYKEIANANPAASDSTFVWVQADTVFVEGNIVSLDSAHGVKINENLVIEDDGTIRMDSSATVWRDELQPLIGKKILDNKGKVTYDLTEFTVVFATDADMDDAVVMNIQLNHDWDGITPVKPHLHWFQEEGNTPNWLIGYRWHQNGETKVEGWTYQQVVSLDPNGNAFAYPGSGAILQISSFGSISPPASPIGVSSILQLKLMRDNGNSRQSYSAKDSYSKSVHALSFDIHIKVNTVGSRGEYAK